MNSKSSKQGARGYDPSLSQQMKQNISKMNDLVVELQEEKQKREILQQKVEEGNQNMLKQNALLQRRVRELELLNAQLEQFNSERMEILQQLQQEMNNYATIQEKFCEEEQSMQSIVRGLEQERQELLNKLAIKDIICQDTIYAMNEEFDDLSLQSDDTSEDNSCSICLSPWDSTGAHRLVSLRCGHLFGSNCIRTALRHSRICPICQKRAHPADVRKIYGSNLHL